MGLTADEWAHILPCPDNCPSCGKPIWPCSCRDDERPEKEKSAMTKLDDFIKLGNKVFTVVEILDEPNTGLLRVRTHYGTYALVPVEFWEAALESITMKDDPPSDRLFCPVCKAKGWTSVVREKGSSAVMGPVDKYYDEEGKYHYHDPSYIKQEYECDQRHKWEQIESASKCWCGWNAEDEAEDG